MQPNGLLYVDIGQWDIVAASYIFLLPSVNRTPYVIIAITLIAHLTAQSTDYQIVCYFFFLFALAFRSATAIDTIRPTCCLPL